MARTTRFLSSTFFFAAAFVLGVVAYERTLPEVGTAAVGSENGAATANAASGSGVYRFLTMDDGVPATWPCGEPIRIAIRRGGVGDDVIADVLASLNTINHTGTFSFHYIGETDAVPDKKFKHWWSDASNPAPVVFAFVQPGETDLLASNAAANGGGSWSLRGGVPTYSSGAVVVDLSDLGGYSAGSGHMSRQALFTHELLHVLNLAHVDDPHSVMTSAISSSFGALGDGDRQGLAELAAISCR